MKGIMTQIRFKPRIALTSALIFLLISATEAASCNVDAFAAEALTEARVWRDRGKIHFEGPGVRLHATVSCLGEPGAIGKIGWVQNVTGWESVREYEHGKISIEAPKPPIWDGGSAAYPWYSDAASTVASTTSNRITLADVPGGETDLQTYVLRNVGAPLISRLQGIKKHTRLEAAVVWAPSCSNIPVVLGVIKWSQTLRLKVDTAGAGRPNVSVENELIEVPTALDTTPEAIAAFLIPDRSMGKFEDVYQAVWTTNNPELKPRVILSRTGLPKIVNP
jgi:hypothetical protein